jgi:tetratricopeptide (TPR) repeat protein
MLYAVAAIVLVVLVLVLWQAFGLGPRRARAYRRAQRQLDAGQWQAALARLGPYLGATSETWRKRLRHLAGECHQYALEEAIKEKRFEDAVPHAGQVVELLDHDEAEQTGRILDALLAEVRGAFAQPHDEGTALAEELIERTRRLARHAGGEVPPEVDFWDALCVMRHGRLEEALPLLTALHERVGKQVIDLPLYLGLLLHRLGRPQEALRYLAEANRIDAACPFVTWQMGVSIVAVGGDSGLALRALQRALGNRGLPLWLPHPERVWVEAFPEGRSYVRRLASRHPYSCPLLGGDLPTIIRQGQLALAQVFYRLDRFQEAADLYGKLLQDSPPTVMLLRGYGLALARLGNHDQAYKQLKIALEQEDPKDPFTAGYLALCGALGKPTRPEDKPRNINWALRLLARFQVLGNEEWANLVATVHSEARLLEMPLSAEDQLLACDALASVQATDPRAASTYAHLAVTAAQEIRPVHAWLYARACCEHGVVSAADLDLFARTFADSEAARTFFATHNWDFEEVEYTYLERSAARSPGQFPAPLGPDYPSRGEAFLLARSRKLEQADRKDPARKCVEVLLALAPDSAAGHDRLACLLYRRGEIEQAVALLGNLQRLAPTDHWPLIRQAVLEQERGNAQRRAEAIDRALGLTTGPQRAEVAFLGARLALRAWGSAKEEEEKEPAGSDASFLEHSRELLLACLRDNPDHVEALWCLAAVRSVLGDREGLIGQAALMDRPGVRDGRFHYLGAVCHLASGNYSGVVDLARRASEDRALEADSHFLLGWAHWHLGDLDAARPSLQKVASTKESASADCARALLGQISLSNRAYDEAAAWWTAIAAEHRAQWNLDEPLRRMVLLSGLVDFEGKRYEQAAERFREAGRLGLRDRRLGGLVTLALVKAGQRLLYEAGAGEGEAPEPVPQKGSPGTSSSRKAGTR